ncbi:FAD-binding dehydrogenase [Ktedonosporobacter rubrisoli]|uniref:FAD-binding dehydrogenase n=1 Tax=Ktedonosporobacter rubrisoli TaxID=2509675 RepID=A0A4P6JIB4_KTERU|nr:FAD-binding dehydrogenase [Ktedonosporobacter rubrisoli]QBD74799.1 FAD-binding dehydrogenase [Ktedonosporobacter rubrisoli]
MHEEADVIIVGAGLAGLVAAAELVSAGRKVILLDQEPEASMGGQAFWSFGGIFLVNSPEQRRMGIKDSHDLALQDWLGSAGFDREEDCWPRRWAEAYVNFASGEKHAWLYERGIRFFPFVQWAERGGSLATDHGNSVPRFHVTWGTGPGIIEPFVRRVREGEQQGLISLRFRHRVTALSMSEGVVNGVEGDVLEPDTVSRGMASSRKVIGDFSLKAQAVIVTAGGIGGNHDLVRQNWPARLGPVPKHLISGVPDHVDGRMLEIVARNGGHLINPDRMWHYPEGIHNYASIWPLHGIRILAGPSPLWLDARGHRLPIPLFPGFDTLATLKHITTSGYDYSWFLLNDRIIKREFALSGSEQNPDLTGRNIPLVLSRVLPGIPAPVQAFKRKGTDFIVKRNLPDLVRAMNEMTEEPLIDLVELQQEIVARDREIRNPFSKDAQVMAIRGMRGYLGDRLFRVTKPHRLLDPAAGPLIAVRLSILTRKTLGGLKTDLAARVLQADDQPLPGLYAAGEIAGFGGGGMHGYRSLEGTFLGGCIFSGRTAGRAVAQAII